MTTHIAVVSDLHINSTVSVAPPRINLDDGGEYRPSKAQRWLWDKWLNLWDNLADLDGKRALVLLGDAAELDTKRRSNQLITVNKATIQSLILDTLKPALEWVGDGRIVVIRGTAAHVGKSSWVEQWLGADIGAYQASEGVYSHYHLRADVEGVRFDLAHHASMGGLPWTSKTAAVRLAARILWEYQITRNALPPDVVLRAHNHRRADSGGNYPCYVAFQPCWSLLTEHGYRIGAENSLAEIGATVFSCEGGKYIETRHDYAPEKGRVTWAKL